VNTALTEHIELDREQRRVYRDGEAVHLTGLEYGLLDYLASHPNRICSRDELLDNVWGKRFHYDPGTIDVHLNALRRKLGWTRKEPVEAVRGVGLIFHLGDDEPRYTVDLQTFLIQWLQSREMEIRAKQLIVQLQLTPFINEITIHPDNLRKMLDSILTALLPAAMPGTLRLTSKLTLHHFTLAIDINGTVNELRIPIHADIPTPLSGDFSISR